MQTASDKEPEAIATCPYNPAHRLPLFRMKRHLVKCKLNNPQPSNEVMVTCPLNNEHRIPQPELAFHLNICPSRVDLDRKLQIPERIDRYVPIEVPEIISPPNDECWDDASAPCYDPTKHVTEQPILRIRNCESRARRIEFRMEERNRIARLVEENQNMAKAGQRPGREESAQSAAAAPWAPLRRPVTQSAAIANRPNIDPYKVNDMLQALDSDQKLLLDSLQNMGASETLVIFPIEEGGEGGSGVPEEEVEKPFGDLEFPALASGGGKPKGSARSVSRGGYASSLVGGRARGK